MSDASPVTRPSAVRFPTVHLGELAEIARRREHLEPPTGPGEPVPDCPNGPPSPAEVEAWARRVVPSGGPIDERGTDELRQQLADKLAPVGLALSGGGVRSASFCLGLLQALARKPEQGPDALNRFDYLSTVSGGGYTGCLLSAVAARTGTRDGPTRPADDRRREVLDRLTRPRANGRPQPLWQRMLYRGQSLGQLFPFLARHVASTLVFNLMLLGGLVCLAALLALVWRGLDRPPVHTFLTWASGERVLEYNRPFLIPLAFFTAYVCVALSRPECSWPMRAIGIGVPMLGLSAWLGLPYLLVLVPTLTIVCLIMTVHSRAPSGSDPDAPNGRGRRPRLGLAVLVILPAMLAGFAWAYGSARWWADLPDWFGWSWLGGVVGAAAVLWLATGVALHVVNGAQDYPLAACMGGLAAAKGTGLGMLAAVIWHVPAAVEPLKPYTYTILLTAALVMLAAHLGLMFFISLRIPRQTRRALDQRMLALAGLTAVVGLAVWVATPNMRFANSVQPEDLWAGSQAWFNRAMAVIAALVLPFVRLQDVLRSGMQTRSPTARFLFNVLCFGLLLGIPFVIIGNLARHNLSGHADRPDRNVNESDVPWEAVLRRLADARQPGQPPAPAGAEAKESVRVAYDRLLSARLAADPLFDRSKWDDPKSLGHEAERAPVVPPEWSDRLRHYGIAVPFGPRTWDSYFAAFDRDRQRARACSAVLHDPAFVWALLRDPDARRFLLDTAHKQREAKGDDRLEAHRKQAAARLEDLLVAWTPRVTDPAYADEFGTLVKGGGVMFDQEVREQLRTIGTLSFFVAYADLPRSRPHGFVTRPVVIVEDQIVRLLIFVLAGLVCGLCLVTVDMNWTSALAFYRRQLQAAYLNRGPADARRTAPDIHDLPNTAVGLPYHLINASVDDRAVGREPALRSEPFVFSALYCGGPNVGYRPTREYRVYSGRGRTRFVDLADAIAISGAAVNPLRVDNWLVRAVLMVTNFRLHQWLPHPRATATVRPTPLNVLRSWPVVAANARRGKVPALVSVADGGFQDNLGVQALLARRCRTIVAVDAGADPDYLFNDLRRVLTWADLHGIKVKFREVKGERPFDSGVAPLLPCDRKPKDHPPETDSPADDGLLARLSGSAGRGVRFHERLADQHFVVADIEYPDPAGKPPPKAVLIYVKPTVTGDEPVELLTFRKAQPAFPNHPTVEQLFDPATVDAYRRLGDHTGERVLTDCGSLIFGAAPPVAAGRPPGPADTNGTPPPAGDRTAVPDGTLAAELAHLRLDLGQRLERLIDGLTRPVATPNGPEVPAPPPAPMAPLPAGADLRTELRQAFREVERELGLEDGIEDLKTSTHNLVAETTRLNRQVSQEVERIRASIDRLDQALAAARARPTPSARKLEGLLTEVKGELQQIAQGLLHIAAAGPPAN